MYEDRKSVFIRLLGDVDEKTIIGAAIVRHLQADMEVDQLIAAIRDMAADNPEVIIRVIGSKAAGMLNIL